MFEFGIEHEVALLDREGHFVDFVRTPFAHLDQIIAQLPFYENDYPYLRVGDAGIKQKRWYIEGFERYDLAGRSIACLPKGIEIRTTIHSTIQGAVDELAESFQLLRKVAAQIGFVPVLTSFHPYRTVFEPASPFNAYEQKRQLRSPEKRTASISALTYGPDLNFSLQGLATDAIINIGRKLTYYSPYIVPFSFSSPFYRGTLWEGSSARTFVRTGLRPAALVFLAQSEQMIVSDPSLTQVARIPAEVGRIEFKACDTCADFAIYAGLLALLKGLALDHTLRGRATVPDAKLHQVSACHAFANPQIAYGSQEILQAAEDTLGSDEDVRLLQPLRAMLQARKTPADDLIRAFQETGSIESALLSIQHYSTEPIPTS